MSIAPAVDQTTEEVLTSALGSIRHLGWCQRALFTFGPHDERRRSCLGGAIYRHARSGASYQQAMSAVQKAIGTGNVDKWNDAPGRTKADVIAALLEALTLLGVSGSVGRPDQP